MAAVLSDPATNAVETAHTIINPKSDDDNVSIDDIPQAPIDQLQPEYYASTELRNRTMIPDHLSITLYNTLEEALSSARDIATSATHHNYIFGKVHKDKITYTTEVYDSAKDFIIQHTPSLPSNTPKHTTHTQMAAVSSTNPSTPSNDNHPTTQPL